ncbi:S9 family peptidase [Candidatus Thorarchaeota archaeon]|nr:MAG: S9 family peptidase [Candidatus Thorarchaeota archaeon]
MKMPQISDVFDVPDLELVSLSHDSRFLLVMSNKENVHHVYQVPLSNSSKWTDLTPGEDRVITGSLSSDDSRFLFWRGRAGDERHNLYVTDLKSHEASLLLDLDSIRVSKADWTPDDRSVLFDGSSASEMALRYFSLSEKEVINVYETERMSAMGFVNPEKPLVTYNERKPDHPTATDTKIIDYERGEVVDTISEKENSRDYDLGWNTDGSKLVIWTNARGRPTLAIRDMESSESIYSRATELRLGIDYEVAKWIPETDDIIYAAKLNGETRLFRENFFDSEDPVELPIPKGWVSAIEVDKNNPDTVFLAWSSSASPTSVCRYSLESGSLETLIDSKPPDITVEMAQAEFLRYPTFDDWEIPAFEVPPSGDAPKLKGEPIIVLVHGGPWWEFSHSWSAMGTVIQAYSTAGFRVFCPNIRGSTGYGDEFMFCNIGDLGGDDLKDVLEARRHLAKKHPNTERFFLTGASYGGFMTFLLLTKHPGVFDAGAAVVGITDWVAMHRLGDAIFRRFTEDFFEGPPDENIKLYRDRSAINFVENMDDPLLVIHRANDSRCPVEPIYTFTGKAISLGKPVEIYVEREAGHGMQRMDHLRQQYGRVIEFFLEHL